jgi:tetratricopeptide (TPR) repeat protein
MDDEMLTPEISAEEMLFHQAIAFIEEGKNAEAREVLTRLLKTDQNNATYWVWLSAAMETSKERLYCLQTALRLDPENTAARRGLTLMGGLPPEEGLTPFPMNHPRPWELKLQLADEKPKEKGFKAFVANPVVRVVGLILAGILLIGGVIGGFAASGAFDPQPTRRALPSFTPLPSPTADMTLQVLERGPLAGLISATYTPTPVYAATPYTGLSSDTYRGAVRAYERGDWNTVAEMMVQVATLNPGSADSLYFVAESHRFRGRYQDALNYYQEAIAVNPNFAPSYLGRARANLALNPRRVVIADLDAAIDLDPDYGEAYLERGLYHLGRNNTTDALADLRRASDLMPGSPLVYLALARLELELENYPEALEAAIRANELDVVMLETYLVLGMAYRANGDTDKALEMLEIYTLYSDDSSEAFMFLGATYFNRGEYEKALDSLNKALLLDNTSSQGYYWRAEIYMILEEYEKARDDYRQALRNNQNFFDAGIGLVRNYYAFDDFNNGYIELLKYERLIQSDTDRANFLYLRAISLGNIGFPREAIRDWEALLALPEEAVTEEMRAEAEEKIKELRQATPPPATRVPTNTPVPTSTRAPTSTP